MAVTVGTTVVTPSGRRAKVRAVEKLYTGKRGRPTQYAVVQLRDAKGADARRSYPVKELKAA